VIGFSVGVLGFDKKGWHELWMDGWMDGWMTEAQYRWISFVKVCGMKAGKHDTVRLYSLTLYVNDSSYRTLFLRSKERKLIHAYMHREKRTSHSWRR
jgi:hypothetical protein